MKRSNLILITVDSLRADRLGFYGCEKNTSPNFDKMADKYVAFDQAIAPGPSTSPSMAAVLTSEYPLSYGGYYYLSERRTSIAEVLAESGYSTFGLHSNPFLSERHNFNKGFSIYEDIDVGDRGIALLERKVQSRLDKSSQVYQVLRTIYRYVEDFRTIDLKPRSERAGIVIEKAMALIQSSSQNFFGWLHFMDTHRPYSPKREFMETTCSKIPKASEVRDLNNRLKRASPELVSEQEVKLAMDLYDAEINYFDYELGKFVKALTNMGVLDNTYLIITADHGEEFGEHGQFGHKSKLYDELLRVPLVIVGPGMDKALRVMDTVSLMDLAPTIVDLLGVEVSEKTRKFRGQSLVALIEGKESRSEGVISEVSHEIAKMDWSKTKIAIRTSNWKYIYSREQELRELYDLRRDPKEAQNVFDSYRQTAERFELEVRARLSEIEEHIASIEKDRIREKIRRRKGKE